MMSVIDAIGEGPIEGPVKGLQSILVNKTPLTDTDGNPVIHGVTAVWRAGEQEQTPPEGFESSGAETALGVEVTKAKPVTRTITSANIDRLRVTFGVQSLVQTTSKGDRNPTSVRLLIQLQRNGNWVTEKDVTINGKTTSQFLASVILDNLPERPFNIRMVRETADSTSDQLQNKTLWSLPSLRRRLFRCVSVRENTDGTFAITAVQHVPEKEAIVDNGARFEPQSGSLNSVIPPAVQHLTVEVSAADGQYLAQAKWDTPRVVKGVRFSLRLTSGKGTDARLVTTAITADTEHRFSGLPLGEYTLTVRAINSYGQQGEPATTTFRINAPAVPATIELTPGYFQITAVPRLAVYDPTVQFEFWFSEAKIADISQVETSARYLGTGSQWSVSGPHIKPGKDFWFYVRSVNLVGKSAFVEASGRASNDAEGYLGLFREKIGKLHLAQGLWELIDNSQLADEMAEMKTTITETRNEITQTVSKTLEDQSATIQQIQRVQKDTNDDLAALYMLKVQKTKNGIPYVAGIGAGIEDTDGQPLSNILLLADRIAMINPEDGNTTPLFVAQGNQLFMNDVFLKRLFAVSITSSGNPPTFSLTPEGRLTARNADISGNVNANSGTLNNVTINENCRVLGKLSANQIEGDLVKTVGKAFPRDSRAPERWPSGTITVRVYDDQPFDRQIVIPAVAFSGAKHEREHTDIYSSCRLIVRKNGAEIYNRTALDNTLIYSGVIDMPAGHGHMTLEFSVSAWLVNNWYPTASISDLLVVVMKKSTAGISIS
ncbi:phage tail tip protein [Escherichia coli]|uniref:phage tail tip domain-containing protein n=1 Tax=Escherichia coli TaxID=562 RepID=UPI00396478D4